MSDPAPRLIYLAVITPAVTLNTTLGKQAGQREKSLWPYQMMVARRR